MVRKDWYSKNICEALSFSSPGFWSFHLSLGHVVFPEEQGKAQATDFASLPVNVGRNTEINLLYSTSDAAAQVGFWSK